MLENTMLQKMQCKHTILRLTTFVIGVFSHYFMQSKNNRTIGLNLARQPNFAIYFFFFEYHHDCSVNSFDEVD